MSDTVTQKVISIIAKTRKIPPEQISLETTFEELGMDSLDGLNLIFELEEEFNISVPDEQALTLRNVGQLVEGVQKILSEGGATSAEAAVQS
jgi:acyl carrier protein